MENRKKLTQEQLKELLSQSTERFSLHDTEIPRGTIKLLFERAFKECVFYNCLFIGDITFTIGSIGMLRFFHCEFGETLNITRKDESAKIDRLLVYKCNAKEVLIDEIFINEIRISKSMINDFEINGTDAARKKMDFYDTKFDGNIELNNYVCSEKIRIQKCIITYEVNILKCSFPKLHLFDTIFNNDVSIEDSKFDLDFDMLEAKKNFAVLNHKFKYCKVESSLFEKIFIFEFDQEWIPNSIILNNTPKDRWIVDTICINSSSFIGGLSFHLDWTDSQYLPIKNLEFICTSNSKGDVFFGNVEIGKCYFKGINKEGSYVFNNCIVEHQMFFYRFINSGKIVFNGRSWSKNTQLFFQDSMLGATSFINTNFKEAKWLNFYDSDISNITFSSTDWFDRVEDFKAEPELQIQTFGMGENQRRDVVVINPENNSKEIFYKNRREMYRQLKNASERQNDRVQSLKFQQLEMIAYRKWLRLTSNTKVSDKIILAAEWTNDFGQNWVRPVIFATIITFLFSIPILIGISNSIYLTLNYEEWCGGFCNAAGQWWRVFPQLMNPLHSLDKMTNTPELIHSATWWLDYLQKLIMAFFIAQTVSAFRKYVKR